jgi:hypothetical protein
MNINESTAEILRQIEEFMFSNLRNVWISDGIINIYIRKSKRMYKEQLFDFFDFASITVIQPSNRGKGLFTNILNSFEKQYPSKNIFVESIVNDKLYKHLKNIGFDVIGDCAYKIK